MCRRGRGLLWWASLCILTLPLSSAIGKTGELNLPADGWVSWRVAAVANAPSMCCLPWGGTQSASSLTTPQRCELDRQRAGIQRQPDGTLTEQVVVYVKMQGGEASQIRSLGDSCAAVADTPIATLVDVSVSSSVSWLKAQAEREPARGRRHDALAAIGMQAGDGATKALASLAGVGTAVELRKPAMLWLAELRGAEGAAIVTPYLFDDADEKIRQHAAVALAQARDAKIAPLLIRQAQTDTSEKVRSQAWFWLAQIRAPEAEAAIFRALDQESARRVRHRAIFALSQLPETRAVAALTRVAETRNLPVEDRKQAIFWLGQSSSTAAMASIDRWLQVPPK